MRVPANKRKIIKTINERSKDISSTQYGQFKKNASVKILYVINISFHMPYERELTMEKNENDCKTNLEYNHAIYIYLLKGNYTMNVKL